MEDATVVPTKEHGAHRDKLYPRLIGELSVAPEKVAPAVAVVVERTGMRPPAWFNSGGVSFADVSAIAVAQRARG